MSSEIINRIKKTVSRVEPTAKVVLFGSYARKEQRVASDIDILVLVNSKSITTDLVRRIKYPLYDIEFETGKIISPLVLSKDDWEKRHRITPFYDNIMREGVVL